MLNYEVGFLQVIRRPQKLQIWFQMGVVRHDQSNSKQRVSYISKLRYEVFFYMWLGIHKYIYVSYSIHMDVVKHTWACQK